MIIAQICLIWCWMNIYANTRFFFSAEPCCSIDLLATCISLYTTVVTRWLKNLYSYAYQLSCLLDHSETKVYVTHSFFQYSGSLQHSNSSLETHETAKQPVSHWTDFRQSSANQVVSGDLVAHPISQLHSCYRQLQLHCSLSTLIPAYNEG